MYAARVSSVTSSISTGQYNVPGTTGQIVGYMPDYRYNVFNQVNWSAINTNAQFNPQGQQVNLSFGQATAARSARIMQGAIRFSF